MGNARAFQLFVKEMPKWGSLRKREGKEIRRIDLDQSRARLINVCQDKRARSFRPRTAPPPPRAGEFRRGRTSAERRGEASRRASSDADVPGAKRRARSGVTTDDLRAGRGR